MLSQTIFLASTGLIALIITLGAMLKGWQAWLALKSQELEYRLAAPAREIEGGASNGAAKIELAHLKERIRKLEAIASGVDL